MISTRDAKDLSFVARLEADPAFARIVVGGSCCFDGRFYEVDVDSHSGAEWLQRFVQEVEGSALFVNCSRITSERGWLDVRYRIGTEPQAEEKVPNNRLGLNFGGPLFDTSAGRCIRNGIERRAERARVPTPITPAVVLRRVRLPASFDAVPGLRAPPPQLDGPQREP
jgi:hypothetical protein